MFPKLLFLLSLSSAFNLTSYHGDLSPNDIFWPIAWQPSVVILTSNHAGDTVNLTLNCHVYEEVPKGAYMEIKIKNFENETYSEISTEDQPLQGDNTLVFTNIVLPSKPGAYGPVSVSIRYSKYGQLLAASSGLTYVAILGPEPVKAYNLTISYATGATRVVGETTSMTISFLITAQLYFNDYFVLYIDPTFDFSQINTGPIWDTTNSDSKYFTNIQMQFDGVSQLIFYGLNQEIQNGAFFKVTVANVGNPDSVVNIRAKDRWSLKIFRFGTPTVKQYISEPGQLQFALAGSLTNVIWDYVYKYVEVNPFFNNSVAYMVLNFTITHPVPTNGSIQITFSSSISLTYYSYITNTTYQTLQTVSNTAPAYLFVSPNTQLSCKMPSSTTVTCSVTVGLSAQDLVSVYNLVYFFGPTPGVLSISTMDSNGYVIDQLNSAYYISYTTGPTYVQITPAPVLYLSDSINYSSISSVGASGDFGLVVSFQAAGLVSPLKESVSVGISYTFSGSDSFNALYFGSVINSYYSSTNASASGPYTELLTTQPGNNDIVVVFPQTITTTQYEWVSIFISSDGNEVQTPLFPSSFEVRYEVVLMYRMLTSYYIYRKPIYFSQTTVQAELELFCTNSPAAGLPAQFTLTPSFDWITDNRFRISIYFAVVNSGWKTSDWLVNGGFGSYPADSNQVKILDGSAEAANMIYLVYSVSSSDLLTTSVPVTITVPLPPGKANSTIYYTGRVYATIIATSDNLLIASSSTNSVSYASTMLSGTKNYLVGTSSIGSQTSDYTLTSTYNIAYFSISFSKGFDITSASGAVVFDNANMLSLYSGLYSENSVQSTSAYIRNVTNTWLITSPVAYVTMTNSMFANTLCREYSAQALVITNSYLTNSSALTPSLTYGLGAQSFEETFYVALEIPGFIQGSTQTFFNLALYTSVTYFEYTLSYSNYNVSGSGTNLAAIPLLTSLQKNEIISLSFNIYLFKVTSPGESIALINNIALAYAGSQIYSIQNVISVYFKEGDSYTSTDNMQLFVFPNIFEATEVFFYVSFTTPYGLPAGTVIEVSGYPFADDPTCYYDTWSSQIVANSNVTNGILYLTTMYASNSSSTVEILKDVAFSNPSSNENRTEFKITASFNGTLIISDDKQTNPAYIFTAKPTTTIYMESLQPEITNMGMQSWHDFTFKVSVGTQSNWAYIFNVPGEYTAHAGEVFNYQEIPNIYFLSSYSSISKISCTVEHWVIICSGMDPVSANTVIDISLLLLNPSSSNSTWILYIAQENSDGSYTFITNPLNSLVVTFTPIPDYKIDILSVNYTNNKDKTVNLSIVTNTDDYFNAGDQIVALFPSPYAVSIYNPIQILCSKTCPSKGVPIFEYCIVQSNSVNFYFESFFNCTNSLVRLDVYFLYNPQGQGFIRNDNNGEIVTDYSEYEYWSEKFEIYTIISSNPLMYNSSSYDNLNSAYTGFNTTSSASILINGGEAVLLTAGTFSDYIEITMNGGVLQADLLKFLATDFNNNKLSFSNQGVYILMNELTTTYFRVGISHNNYDGFYYITWSIQETPLIAGVNKYDPPSKTQVQVFSTIPQNISVPAQISLPINSRKVLTIDFNGLSPYDNVTVKLALDSSCTEVIILDPSLLADSSITVLYTMLQSGATEGSCKISYSISGGSVSAFYLPINTTLVTVVGNYTATNISSGVFNVNGNSADLGVIVREDVIVYWVLMSSHLFNTNSTLYELEFIKNNSLYIYGEYNSSKTVEYQILDLEIRIAAVSSDSWGDTCVGTMIIADKTAIYGTSFVPNPVSGPAIFQSFSNLILNTTYTLVTYIEYMSGNVTYISVQNSTPPYSYSIPISIKFDSAVDINNVISAAATAMSVAQSRIVLNVLGSRMLIVAEPILLLPSVRSSLDPLQITSRLTDKTFIANYNSMYPNSTVNEVTVSITTTGISAINFGMPNFLSFFWMSVPGGFAANYSVDSTAQVCCVVSLVNVTVTGATIQFGYDDNDNAFLWKSCNQITIGRTENVTFLAKDYNVTTNFNMYCIPCNLYPVIPACNQAMLNYYNVTGSQLKSFAILGGLGMVLWVLS